MMPKFQIGDTVWYATYDSSNSSVVCPDCGGTGQMTVEMFDQTRHSIQCEGCKSGYEAPTGRIKTYDRRPSAVRRTITGMRIDANKVEYSFCDHYIAEEDRIFATEAEALARAEGIAAEATREETARIQNKTKQSKSWSWHVHYHRRAIRDAEKAIAHHTAMLNVARVKAKEPAEAPR